MICAKCLPATVGAPALGSPAVLHAAPRGGGFVSALALVGAALGGIALSQSIDARDRLAARPDLSAKLDDAERRIERLLEDGVAARGRVETLNTRLEKLAGEPALLRDSLTEQLLRIEAIERSTGDLSNLLAKLRSDKEMVTRLELVQARLESDLAALKGQVQGITARIIAIATAPAPPDGTREPTAEADGGAPTDAIEKFDADTKRLIAELANKDEGVRWEAVEKLAKKRNAAVVPFLLPVLGDKDTFVKFRAISAMRELDAKGAIAPLLKLLRDEQQIVREEAQEALVALTGNHQRHNMVDGSAADREKGVKAWEEWWDKNKSRFTDGAASSS